MYQLPGTAVALSTGVGRTRVRQKDSSIEGGATVLETGLEAAVPRRGPAAFRLFALWTWTLGRARWTGTDFRPTRINALHLGLGVLLQ